MMRLRACKPASLVSMHPEQPSRRPLDAYLVDRDLLQEPT